MSSILLLIYFAQFPQLTPRDKRRRTIEPICTMDHSVERNCTILPKKVVTTLISHLNIKPVVEYHTDQELSNYLLRLMKVHYQIAPTHQILLLKIHNRLIECVMLLDKMFNVQFSLLLQHKNLQNFSFFSDTPSLWSQQSFLQRYFLFSWFSVIRKIFTLGWAV